MSLREGVGFLCFELFYITQLKGNVGNDYANVEVYIVGMRVLSFLFHG